MLHLLVDKLFDQWSRKKETGEPFSIHRVLDGFKDKSTISEVG